MSIFADSIDIIEAKYVTYVFFSIKISPLFYDFDVWIIRVSKIL